MLRTFLLYLTSLLASLVFSWLCGLAWFVSQIPDTPAKLDQPVDAIVVLTGGAMRVEQGLELLAEGKGKKLFISGVGAGVRLKDLYKNKPQQKYLKFFNDDYYITLGHEAADTKGNALETAQWIKKENVNSILLVTSYYHIPRSLYEFRSALPQVTIIAGPVFPTQDNETVWWQSEESRRLILTEYHKYILSHIKDILFVL